MTATPSLSQIKSLRKKHHLTQKQLADQAHVSQSLIAKVEAGRLDPGYSKAQQIFQALDELQAKQELKAKDVMKSKVVFASANSPVKSIIHVMKQKGISQLPVRERGNIVGLISEGTILAHVDTVASAKVLDIMDDAPPIISPATGLRTVRELVKDNQVVLVAEKGKLKGIISKSDVLGKME